MICRPGYAIASSREPTGGVYNSRTTGELAVPALNPAIKPLYRKLGHRRSEAAKRTSIHRRWGNSSGGSRGGGQGGVEGVEGMEGMGREGKERGRLAVAQGWNGDRADGRAFPRPLGRRPLCARVGARWRSVKAGTPLVDRAAPPVSREQSLSRRRCGKTRRRRLRWRGERNLKKRNTKHASPIVAATGVMATARLAE